MPSLTVIRRKALKVARDPAMIVRFLRQRIAARVDSYRRMRVLRPHQRTILRALGPTPPVPLETDGPIEVHILCGRATVPDALAMLKSFYGRTGATYPLVVHEDGTFGDVERTRFAEHFPGTRIIPRRQADAEVDGVLGAAGMHRCIAYRHEQIYGLKLFDLEHYGRGKRVLYLDTDILFFTRPDALLDALHAADDRWVDRYNEDIRTCYTWSAERVKDVTGLDLLPRVNSGLLVLRIGTPDWTSYESWLTMPERSFYSEQTLRAMYLSAAGARALPSDYDVCFRHAWQGHDWDASLAEKRLGQEVVSEHFCGNLGSRVLFYERFMQRVVGTLSPAG
jgi:hypothetical protein